VKVTADDIAQLLASPPPRAVAPHVAQAAAGGRGIWGGVVFGLLFGAFGSIFLLFFFPWRLPAELELDWLGRTAPAVIVSQADTNMSVNETRVVAHRFRFTAPDGRQYTAEAYTTGPRWGEGQMVAARYLKRDPAVACLDGARLNQAGWWAGFVVIFPLAGFGMAWWALASRRRLERLLRTGAVVEVDVINVEATSVKINYQTIYKITVAAPGLAGGQPVTVKRWAKPDVNLATQRALHKQPVFVLLDPRKPKDLIFPEGWIGA
jgi:hypothetical protein